MSAYYPSKSQSSQHHSSEGVAGCLGSCFEAFSQKEELSPARTTLPNGHNSHFTSKTSDGRSFNETSGKRTNVVKIVCISDTHNGHNELHFDHQIRQITGDILIHAGDFSNHGSSAEVESVLSWLKSLNNFEYKILIAGNMDGIDLDDPRYGNERRARQLLKTASGVIYLENDSCILHGIKIYGCPYTPRFCGGFQYDRHSSSARSLWDMIPNNCDILVSHGPPRGILDQTSRGERVGCDYLAEAIRARSSLKAIVFGHVHNAHGWRFIGEKCFINAAQHDGIYRRNPKNGPVVLSMNAITKKVDHVYTIDDDSHQQETVYGRDLYGNRSNSRVSDSGEEHYMSRQSNSMGYHSSSHTTTTMPTNQRRNWKY